MQIDLSDNMVVAQLFGNSAWLDVMEPLKVRLMRSGFGVGGSSRGSCLGTAFGSMRGRHLTVCGPGGMARGSCRCSRG